LTFSSGSHIEDQIAIRWFSPKSAKRRRGTEKTMATHIELTPSGAEPTYVLEGREALSPVFDDLNRYEATMRALNTPAH
jgi:hypothetical protein